MGTRERPGDYDCHERAEPNEPRFTLIGRDPTAGALVRLWVRLRTWLDPTSVEAERAKYEEALRCADAMDQWAAQISKRKRDQVSAVTNELTVTLGIGNAGRLRAPRFETQEIDEGNGVTMVIESPQGDRVRIRKGEGRGTEDLKLETKPDTPRADAAIAMLDEIVRVFRNDDGTIASTTTPREIVEYCEERANALRRERDRVREQT